MNFKQLSELLRKTSDNLFQQAIKAVNINLTLRNWLFGYYIVEYEQNGEDRARYGKRLLKKLADNVNVKGLSETNLKYADSFILFILRFLGYCPKNSNF